MTAAKAARQRSIARPWLLAAGLALALAGCEAPQTAGGAAAPTVTATPGAAPGTAAALAEALPASAAGFNRGATVPVRQPMEGLEVNYATLNRRGAAFVQLVQPGSGTAQEAAAAEYARWLAETSTGARPGRRLAVSEEFTEAAGPGLRCASLTGSYGRQPVQSTLCVGATGGQVVRLRVSMMRDTPPAADARGFVQQVAQGLPRG